MLTYSGGGYTRIWTQVWLNPQVSLLARSPSGLYSAAIYDQDPALISKTFNSEFFCASHQLWGKVQRFWKSFQSFSELSHAPPVTGFLSQYTQCDTHKCVHKYKCVKHSCTYAHKAGAFSFSLLKLTLSSCPSSDPTSSFTCICVHLSLQPPVRRGVLPVLGQFRLQWMHWAILWTPADLLLLFTNLPFPWFL